MLWLSSDKEKFKYHIDRSFLILNDLSPCYVLYKSVFMLENESKLNETIAVFLCKIA